MVNFYKNYKACSNVTNRYEILKKKKIKKIKERIHIKSGNRIEKKL